LACASAHAQRAVPVARVTPPSFELVDVDVPDLESEPVRLRFAPAGQRRAELLVDVRIAGDRRGAQDAAQWLRETTAGPLRALEGIGDAAAGDAGFVAFVRDEVFVVVRRIGGAHDAVAIARGLDAALLERIDAPLPGAFVRVPTQVEASAPIVLSPEILAAHVLVEGPGLARRTPAGWTIARTGAGPLAVRVIAFDRGLRRLEHRARVR
jgi:hypothetical protein